MVTSMVLGWWRRRRSAHYIATPTPLGESEADRIDPVLSRGVMAYVGVAGRYDPAEPEQRLLAALGDPGLELLPRIKALIAGVYAAVPPEGHLDLLSMCDDAERYLRQNHEDLSDEAIRAVVNRFGFDWR